MHTEEETKAKERTKCVPFQKIAHNQSSHSCKIKKREHINISSNPKRRKRGSSSDFDKFDLK